MRQTAYGAMGMVGLAALIAAAASGEATPPPGENLRDLGGGNYAYISGSNSGFVVTDAGILVVDALRSPRHARELIKEIRTISDKDVLYLVNTHWHWDHTFGNDAFPEATKVYSTEACKTRLEKDGPKKWSEVSGGKPKDYEGAKLVIPEVTFTDETTLTLGDREFSVKYIGKGHTDGDAVVMDRENRVIYAGDLLFSGMHPYMADGYSRDWAETLGALQALAQPEPEKWKLVPGHGEPASPALAADLVEYIQILRGEVKKALDAGTPVGKIAAGVTLPEKFSKLEAPGLLEMNVNRIAAELGGGEGK